MLHLHVQVATYLTAFCCLVAPMAESPNTSATYKETAEKAFYLGTISAIANSFPGTCSSYGCEVSRNVEKVQV